MRFTKITIVSIKKPQEHDLNETLQWFGASLGLFGARDKDKSCFRIFIELIKNLKEEEPISSDEIAQRTGLTRGTVVHHLNKLMSSGIVTSEKNGYQLKVDNLEGLTNIVKDNVDRAFDNLKEIAKDLDRKLRL
ncbi:MAG: helix-turn-helix domain-containing protein [Nanoarchaeota archaeon]|nr:helix-turn-helix domain-containing protein [Nanoarchaeota archaeon]MBU1269472.1 helix-turn-helix domain-containing protein [Nanoarchaeota archaeon]MBU1603732.1 helix-turn-helix domain-containing protein [Nanoarchaeota archaeon]MBU2443035.1 helix-turn-helix domain-containing protein [Nanoarchaeota archaeon]